MDERAKFDVEQIREALGAVAAAEPAVFWIYMDRQRRWHVRQEGAAETRRFAGLEAARSYVEVAAARCQSFRLFQENEAGGFTEESFGWPPGLRRVIPAGDDGALGSK
jgi:hypothetical protein